MQGLLLGEGRWNEPTACGWMAGWMAILIPASGIWKSEVKGRASQGCTSAGGRLLLPPPLPPPPRRVRSGPPGGNEPLAPSPSVPPGQEPETPASCGAGKRWATPGFPSAFREHVTARRKPRRAGEGRGEGQLTRSLSLGSARAFAGGLGEHTGRRGRPRGARGPSREASGSERALAGGLGERAGPRGRPRGARGACRPPAVPAARVLHPRLLCLRFPAPPLLCELVVLVLPSPSSLAAVSPSASPSSSFRFSRWSSGSLASGLSLHLSLSGLSCRPPGHPLGFVPLRAPQLAFEGVWRGQRWQDALALSAPPTSAAPRSLNSQRAARKSSPSPALTSPHLSRNISRQIIIRAPTGNERSRHPVAARVAGAACSVSGKQGFAPLPCDRVRP